MFDAKNAATVRRAMRDDAIASGRSRVRFGDLITLSLTLYPIGWQVHVRASTDEDVWTVAANGLSFDDAVTVVTRYARNMEG